MITVFKEHLNRLRKNKIEPTITFVSIDIVKSIMEVHGVKFETNMIGKYGLLCNEFIMITDKLSPLTCYSYSGDYLHK